MTIKEKVPNITTETLSLRLIDKRDIEFLRNLRNKNRELFFHSSVITPEQQLSWFSQYLKKEDDIVFIIENTDGSPIGSISLYNITSDSAELGRFMVDQSERNKGFGIVTIQEIISYGLNELGLNNIYLEVKDDNNPAISLYEKVGFVRSKTASVHPSAIHMEIKK